MFNFSKNFLIFLDNFWFKPPPWLTGRTKENSSNGLTDWYLSSRSLQRTKYWRMYGKLWSWRRILKQKEKCLNQKYIRDECWVGDKLVGEFDDSIGISGTEQHTLARWVSGDNRAKSGGGGNELIGGKRDTRTRPVARKFFLQCHFSRFLALSENRNCSGFASKNAAILV